MGCDPHKAACTCIQTHRPDGSRKARGGEDGGAGCGDTRSWDERMDAVTRGAGTRGRARFLSSEGV